MGCSGDDSFHGIDIGTALNEFDVEARVAIEPLLLSRDGTSEFKLVFPIELKRDGFKFLLSEGIQGEAEQEKK